MMRTLIGAVMAMSLAGCVLAPSDPELPPVGLRVDDGILTAYVPLCPGEHVESADVELINISGDGERIWSGENPRQPASKVVTVDTSGWTSTDGRFTYEGQEFALTVKGTQHSYGLTLYDDKTVPSGLPPGVYDDNGRQVTASDLDAASLC